MCYIASHHDILLQDPYMGYFADLEPEFAPELEA